MAFPNQNSSYVHKPFSAKFFWTAVILILAASNIFYFFKSGMASGELERARANVVAEQTNGEILAFASLFIEEVLKSDEEIDFETRLLLENKVREIEDEEIMAKWQAFVGSKNEADAQANVKELLSVLVRKIKS